MTDLITVTADGLCRRSGTVLHNEQNLKDFEESMVPWSTDAPEWAIEKWVPALHVVASARVQDLDVAVVTVGDHVALGLREWP